MFDMTEGFHLNPFVPAPQGHSPLTRAAVLGAGAWGTALASALQRGNLPTRLWARRPEVAQAIKQHQRHPDCLEGIALPEDLDATADLAHAVKGAQLVILAVPSAATRSLAGQIAGLLAPGTVVLTASKGIEKDTGALMTGVLDETLGTTMLTGSIGGPSFADEVARGQSTLLTLALPALADGHPRQAVARRIADSLARRLDRASVSLEMTDDAVGAQVGGALKNMIAIACGMAMAQELGENARAGIITRGLDDMRRLTLALGGRVDTLLRSSGVGDLFLTAASEHSRNTRLGMRLGRGAVASPARELTEGAVSVISVQVLEHEHGLHLGVAAAVRDVLEQRKTAAEALRHLLHARSPGQASSGAWPPKFTSVRSRFQHDDGLRFTAPDRSPSYA